MNWHDIDHGAFLWAYGLNVPEWLALAFTHLATRGGVWALIALGLLVFGRGMNRRTGIALVSGFVAHILLVEGAVKHLVERQRPYLALHVALRDGVVDPASYSFPSGHTAASFLSAWILGARWPRWRAPLFVVAALIGFSRPLLGAHYPSDVFAGAVFGTGIGFVLTTALGIAPDATQSVEDAASAGV